MLVHFLSLNAQGFRNQDKQREVMHFARARNVDVLFLQECNFRTPRDVSLFKERFCVDAFFTLSNSPASGVGVIFLRPSLRQKAHVTFGFDGRTIAVDFYLFSRRVRAVNVYAPAQRHLSTNFFASLDVYLLDSYPTFLVGDFNCVLDPVRDLRGPGQGRPRRGACALGDLVDQFRLSDAWVQTHGGTFAATWARGASASRLDKFYLPPELSRCLESCEVLVFPSGTPRISDHSPVSVKLVQRGTISSHDMWRMDICLLADPDSVASLKDQLKPGPQRNEWEDLKSSWRKILMEAGRKRKARISRELDEALRRLRIIKSGQMTFAMRDYEGLLRARYERLLRQSSSAAGRAFVQGRPLSDPSALRYIRAGSVDDVGRAHVPHVVLPNGAASSRPADISEVFTHHFREFFKASGERESSPEFEENVRNFCGELPQVPSSLADTLTAPVSYEELWDAVGSMNQSSAPGPDGIPLSFYKAFFSCLKDPLLEMVNAFFTHGVRPLSFKEGNIVLITKPGGEPSDPRAYRPITLLNTDYKIVATIISRRLSKVLPHVMSPAQTCSVPGRSIFSALSLTRDLFAFATRTGIPGCFVSLDQAKAFDRVEHRYLMAVLRSFGFPMELITRLNLLYRGLTSRLLVNGQLSAPFPVERGIRQGCPLSPLLFVLAIDPLLRRVANSPGIRGFPLPGQAQVKVSAYADDVSLFLRDDSSFTAFSRLYSIYSELSGAQINRGKSKALRFGAFTSDLWGEVEWIAAVKVLGVTYHASGEVARETWTGIVKKAKKRLSVAAQFKLSFTERSFVIKACVSSALYYVARIARPPRNVVRKLESKFFSFFWGGKTERVARAFMRLPTSMGGYSLPCMSTMCSVLALRRFVDLTRNPDYIGSSFLNYFLGTSRGVFYSDPYIGPLAEEPPSFYTYVTKTFRELLAQIPDLEISDIAPSELCEQLAVAELTAEQKARSKKARWRQLTSSVLPADVKDFGWERGWGVLPTRDRLTAWGVTPSARCPQCGQNETLRHAIFQCSVARTFWTLMSRMFKVRLGERTKSRDALVTFLLCVGALVVWRRRGVAALRSRPHKAMFPMLLRMRTRLFEHLEAELATLGEEAFLLRWSCRFIKVNNARLEIRIVEY